MLAEPTAQGSRNWLPGRETKPLCQRSFVGRSELEIGNGWDQSFPGERIKCRGLLTVLVPDLHICCSSLLQVLHSFH